MLKRFDLVTNHAEIAALSRSARDVASYDALAKREYETALTQAQLALEIQVNEENTNSAVRSANARKAAAEKRAKELHEIIAAKKLAKASTTSEGYRAFLNRVGHLYAELSMRKAVFAQVASYAPRDLRYSAVVESAYTYCSGWVRYADQVERELLELEAQGRALSESGADATSLNDVRQLLDDVSTLYTQCVGDIAREHGRRETRAESVADFMRSQSQLVHWCRAQKTALEAVQDVEQIQELCTSFHNNIAVMETNLLVLLELSEPLSPDRDISNALMEVNEVWLSLSVYAYERMRDALLEQHSTSGLQLAAKRWLTELSDPLRKFLDDAKTLLLMPTDEESRSVTQPALEQCTALAEDFTPHHVIMEHLSDFSVREECLKEHYTALRRSVFAKLTLSTLSFHGQVHYPRRQEYTDRLAELTDWVQCKSQSNSWKQLLSRVEKMKQLVEENEALHGTAEDRSA